MNEALQTDFVLHTGSAIAILVTMVFAIVFYLRWRDTKTALKGTEEALDQTLREASACKSMRRAWEKTFGRNPFIYYPSAGGGAHNANLETIAVDLDGVVAEYDGTWRGPHIIGDPLPGAAEGIQRLRDLGFRVCIYTTRINPITMTNDGSNISDMLSRLHAYLRVNDIPYDYISIFKPLAAYYIDDRAIRHVNWSATLKELECHEYTKGVKLQEKMAEVLTAPMGKNEATQKNEDK